MRVSLRARLELLRHLGARDAEELAAELLTDVVALAHQRELIVRVEEDVDEHLHEDDMEQAKEEKADLLTFPHLDLDALDECLFIRCGNSSLLLILLNIVHLLDLLDSIGDLQLQVFVVLEEVDGVHPALQDDVQDRRRVRADGRLQREDFVA